MVGHVDKVPMLPANANRSLSADTGHFRAFTLMALSIRRYSSRRASVGLTLEGRHAGMNAAASAPTARTSTAPATVAGSVAVTPNNWDWTSLPKAATQGSARATPAAII